MAFYKYAQVLQQHNDGSFDWVLEPATATPYSGIYRCEGCGHEAISTFNHPLPPQNHHQHGPSQGRIRWRLVVMASHR